MRRYICLGNHVDPQIRSTRILRQIFNRFKKLTAPRLMWTVDEDNLLRDAVRKYGVRRWDLVALDVPNRNELTCSARWEELQSRRTACVRQPWSMQDDKLLTSLVRRHGASQWPLIASLVPERNAKQCRDRWHNQLDPLINRSEWTSDEDALLVSLQRRFGNAWSRIATHLPGRTDNAIKNRWHSAQLRQRKNDEDEDSFQAVEDVGQRLREDSQVSSLDQPSDADAWTPISTLESSRVAPVNLSDVTFALRDADDLDLWTDLSENLFDEVKGDVTEKECKNE